MRRIVYMVMPLFLVLMAGASEPASDVVSRITIAATGDVMVHMAVIRCARRHNKGAENNYGYDYMFEKVAPLIKSADIASCNAEFPAAARLRHGRKMCVFNAPKGIVGAIKKAGFDVANLANNHSYDQGITAIGETVQAFKDAGLIGIGAGRTAREAERFKVVEYNGWRVAFIGASDLIPKRVMGSPPDVPHVNGFDIDKMVKSIKAARRKADVVVVNVHWGSEYKRQAREREVEFAKTMMRAGADMIAGHHPHVLQQVIVHNAKNGRKRIAAMSLGNFVSNQAPKYAYGRSKIYTGDTRAGAFLRAVFEKDDSGVRLVTWDAVPLWTWTDRLEKRACSSCTFNFQVLPIPDALKKIERQIASRKTGAGRRAYLKTMHKDLSLRCTRTLNHLGVPKDKWPVVSAALPTTR